MIAYGAAELASSFRTVRKNTVQVAEDIPEEKYGFIAGAGVRSPSDLLKHILYAPLLYETMHRQQRVTTLEGFDFAGAGRRAADEEKKPKSKAEILTALRAEGERIAQWLASLDDAFLNETFSGAGGQIQRTRFESLLSIKEHEMHHRGQLMVIERLVGVVPHLTRQREERIRQRQAAAAAALRA